MGRLRDCEPVRVQPQVANRRQHHAGLRHMVEEVSMEVQVGLRGESKRRGSHNL